METLCVCVRVRVCVCVCVCVFCWTTVSQEIAVSATSRLEIRIHRAHEYPHV